MKIKGIDPLGISFAIAFHELIKLLFGPYTGAIADKYSIRYVMSLGLFIKSIGFFAWIFISNIFSFFIAIILIGIGSSCILGKIDAFAYNFLASKNLKNKFDSFLIKCSLIECLASVFVGLIILKFNNYNYLILFSVCIIYFIHIPWIVFKIKDQEIKIYSYKKQNILTICKESFDLLLKQNNLLFFVFLSSLPLTIHIVSSDLYKMIIADFHLCNKTLGVIYIFSHLLPIITSFLFLPIFKIKKIKSIHGIFILFLCSIFYLAGFFFYGTLSIIFLIIIIAMVPIFNAIFRNKLESIIIQNEKRATITSFCSVLTGICNILCFIFIGFFGRLFGYNFIFLLFFILMFTIAIFSICILSKE